MSFHEPPGHRVAGARGAVTIYAENICGALPGPASPQDQGGPFLTWDLVSPWTPGLLRKTGKTMDQDGYLG